MKKGIFSSTIGVIVFLFVFGIISFNSGFSKIFTAIPVLVIIGIVFAFKSIAKNAKNIEKKYNSHFDNSQLSMTQCNSCHSPIEKTANYCPVCGEVQDSTIKCEYCGYVNPSSNALCEKCNGFL